MAFVRVEGNDREFIVRGSKNRNRAVHGDVVIVQPVLLGRTEDSSSDEEPPKAAINDSDSEEEVVFAKPHLAGGKAASSSKAAAEPDVQMAKVVAIGQKKGQGR
ncbi:unnamed protein product, partial [Effrenium voratum]